jgi:3-phosphoglycerate kinase
MLMEKELKYLSAALANPARPYIVVLGGAKVSDKLPLIHHMLASGKVDEILIGGAMAYTFCAAAGWKIGSSRIEAEMVEDAKKILDEAMHLKCKIILPQDHVCNTVFAHDSGQIKTFDGELAGGHGIPDGFMGLDIGPKTQTDYASRLRRAKTIVWNGPMGVFEWKPFQVGTLEVAEAIVEATQKNGATSIVGGGDSAAAAEQFGLAEKFSHVSTGGGASLEMLAGKPFRTVEILDEA